MVSELGVHPTWVSVGRGSAAGPWQVGEISQAKVGASLPNWERAREGGRVGLRPLTHRQLAHRQSGPLPQGRVRAGQEVVSKRPSPLSHSCEGPQRAPSCSLVCSERHRVRVRFSVGVGAAGQGGLFSEHKRQRGDRAPQKGRSPSLRGTRHLGPGTLSVCLSVW